LFIGNGNSGTEDGIALDMGTRLFGPRERVCELQGRRNVVESKNQDDERGTAGICKKSAGTENKSEINKRGDK